MGFYFRKSFGLGPLRMNLSKGGVGLSGGVRGARIGVDARGRTYVHCGRGGIYYKSYIGGSANGRPVHQPRASTRDGSSTVGEHRVVESGDVSAMAPVTAASLLAELQRRNRLFSWHVPWVILLGGAGAATAILADETVLGGVLIATAVVGAILLAAWTRRRRTFRLDYQLDDAYRKRYTAALTAFERLRGAQRVWLVESAAEVYNRKYHAGASSTIRRTRVAPICSLPPCIKSNMVPPMVPAGRQRIYLLPDRILVYEGRRVGAVEYGELHLEATTTRFVEDEHPPTDAQQVHTTWRYVNKNGGPDRRFNDNRQLPVMEYGELRWSSASGLNEVHQVSDARAAAAFAQAVARLAGERAADTVDWEPDAPGAESDRDHSDDSPATDLTAAASELGLDLTQTTWEDIDARFRELAKQYHPDVLASKGLPPDVMQFSTERFKRIRDAYDTLRSQMG